MASVNATASDIMDSDNKASVNNASVNNASVNNASANNASEHLLRRLIRGESIERPIIALAPMAGVTDLPFRNVCEQLGADYSVCEMVASKPELLLTQKSQSRRHFSDYSSPNIIQLVGNNPDEMALASAFYTNEGAEIIDINLGCPAKKVNGCGAGSALLQDLSRIDAILAAMTAATDRPITIKTRLGWSHDHYTLFELLELAEKHGIALLTVHGRTRACRFNGHASYELIAKAKQQTTIPIIVNGDIDSAEKAHKVLEQTACDGIMIGRAAVGNPWLFSDIKERLTAHHKPQPTSQLMRQATQPVPSKISVAGEHIRATQQFYEGITGIRYARKHIQKYLSKITNNDTLFQKVASIECAEEQLSQFTKLLEEHQAL